jgi:hypothetical protein
VDRDPFGDDVPSERREERLTLTSIACEIEEIIAYNVHCEEPLNAPLRGENARDQRSARGYGAKIVGEPVI